MRTEGLEQLNMNMPKYITDDNFNKTYQLRKEEFTTKAKIVFENFIKSWHQDFFINIGENIELRYIAEGYSAILWNELNLELLSLSPIIIEGIGVKAVEQSIFFITSQFTKGVEINYDSLAYTILQNAEMADLIVT